MSGELWKLSAIKMAEGIRNREFSCEEVVNSVTNRIQKLNPSLNAVVGDLNPTAVDEARKSDRELESKKATGPDTIPAGQYKASPTALEELHDVLLDIWTSEEIPDDFTLADAV